MTVAAILASGCLLAGTLAGLDVSDRTLEIADATDVQVSAASDVRIGRDGVVRIGDGGRLSVTTTDGFAAGSPAVFIDYRGALLHVDGGVFSLSGKGYLCNCSGWSDGVSVAPPEVRMTSGEMNLSCESGSAFLYYSYGYGRMTLTGGTLNLTPAASTTSAILCYGDSTALQASGDAAINVARGRIRFSRGKFSFAGSSGLSLAGGGSESGFYLGDSDTANRKATLTVSDAANVDLSGAWFVQLGSKSNAYPSESVLNVNGGKLTLGYHNVIGAGVNRSELSIGGGATVRVPHVGLSIGSPYYASSNFGANGSGCFATGVVSVANGTLANEGDGNNADWGSDRMAGLIVGNGTVPLSSGAWFSGLLNVGDGAFVTNGPCPVVVGIGLGEGKVVQTGGTVVSTGTYGLSQNGGPRGSWEAKPVVIGALGGRGEYVMSGGAATFAAAVFVGGIESNRFCRTFRIPPEDFSHRQAKGHLSVSGGTFRTKSGLFVGCDGSGTVDVSGDGRLVVTGNLVLSNAVHSTLRLKPSAGTDPLVDIGGRLVLSDAARVVVDMTDVPADTALFHPLVRCDAASAQAFAARMTVLGDYRGTFLCRDGVWGFGRVVEEKKGFVLMIRGEPPSEPAHEFVVNGSFEQPGKWSVSDRVYSFPGSEGVDASRCLRWTNDDPSAYLFASQSLKLLPGLKYRFACRVRQENVVQSVAGRSELGAAMLVSWYSGDPNNPVWMGETQVSAPTGSCGWTDLKGETPTIPDEATLVSVCLFVNRGCVGTAWFDDASVTPAETPPVASVMSSAYRNVLTDGESADFIASLAVDTYAHPLSTLEPLFRLVGADGSSRALRPGSFTYRQASVLLKAEDLQAGSGQVAFELRQRRTGAVIGAATTDVCRVAQQPARRAFVDRHRRLVVDGEPFFPLGMYVPGGNDRTLVDAYATGPWNCCLSYTVPDLAYLDYMSGKGLKVIHGLHNHELTPEGDAACRAAVLAHRDHPAVIGWYLFDEMPVSRIREMAARNRLVREADPDHPTYAVFDKVASIRDYLPAADVLGTDPYPIADQPVSIVTDHVRQVMKGTFGFRSVWQVVQAFDWAWFVDPELNRTKCRMPTREEVRSMAWQAVAGGANGVLFWCFHHPYWKLPAEDFAQFQSDYAAVGAEIRSHIPILLLPEATEKLLSVPATMSARVWTDAGRTYLLVCNLTREDVAGDIWLSGWHADRRNLLDGGESEVDGGRVPVTLPPLGVGLFDLAD